MDSIGAAGSWRAGYSAASGLALHLEVGLFLCAGKYVACTAGLRSAATQKRYERLIAP
jgi:hypothetical protein